MLFIHSFIQTLREIIQFIIIETKSTIIVWTMRMPNQWRERIEFVYSRYWPICLHFSVLSYALSILIIMSDLDLHVSASQNRSYSQYCYLPRIFRVSKSKGRFHCGFSTLKGLLILFKIFLNLPRLAFEFVTCSHIDYAILLSANQTFKSSRFVYTSISLFRNSKFDQFDLNFF